MKNTIRVDGFLVVRGDGTMRVLKSTTNLRRDEVAFRVTVSIPVTWGRVQNTTIELELPEPPEPRITIGEAELTPDDDEDGDQ